MADIEASGRERMTTTPTLKRAKLRTAVPSFGSVEVDEDKGTIRNAAVMTIGPAQGHGFEIDRTSLQQLVDSANAIGGEVKMRYRHPTNPNEEDLGTDVGVLKNLRIVGDQVRGDIQLHSYAKSLPGIGNVWDYLIGKAKQAPSSFGLSAVIAYDIETVLEGKSARLFARISGVDAVDFVGRPAANPRGLLSKQPRKSQMSYESTFRPALEAMGLKSDASDEQAAAFFDALDPDKQSEIANADSEADAEPAQMSAKSDSEVAKLEIKRINTLKALAKTVPTIDDNDVAHMIAQGMDLNEGRKFLLSQLESRAQPVRSIRVGESNSTKGVVESCAMALLARAGVLSRDAKLDDRTRRLADQPATETGRALLSAVGVDTRNMNRGQLAKVMMSPRTALASGDLSRWASLSQTTSDFDNLMSTSASLALKTGYNEQPVTWPLWAKRGTFDDFTTQERVVLSNIGTPPEVREGAEYTNTNLGDGKESFTPKKYGSIIQLTY
ncbi:MAG TPA: hypothetical protein PK402_09890, partial [Tepidisphaeraceae bacterium]|nr:hypothetical protein [Tepidisphaeraceae bacterium]